MSPVAGLMAVKTAVAGASLVVAGAVARRQKKRLEQELRARPVVSQAAELRSHAPDETGMSLHTGLKAVCNYLLPGSLFAWIVMGVLPAINYRLAGQPEMVDQLLPTNAGFIILCCSLWLTVFVASCCEKRQSTQQIRTGPHEPQKESHTPRHARGKPPDVHKLAGRWEKCKEESESLDDACEAMHLNFIMKRAVNFVNLMEIEVTDSEFRIALQSIIPWFKIREHYPWDGSSREHRRRDFRGGHSTGHVEPIGTGSVDMKVSWKDPYTAQESCKVALLSANKCETKTIIHFASGRVASYRQVFYRANTPH